jgi:AraC family transcriptional regulator of adaptative response/methylated-DNA-[protein]-cysteine methyltransferase
MTVAMYPTTPAGVWSIFRPIDFTMPPRAFRKHGPDPLESPKVIRLVIVPCRLGWLAASATERGLCMLCLGDTSQALHVESVARFPSARVEDGNDELNGWAQLVLQQIDAAKHAVAIPLDLQGTSFQRTVWDALRAIPAGATATYTAVARAIGRPSAVRAVANACGANPVAVVVPCHRVIRSNGDLGGYRWGIERKRQLLERDRLGQAQSPSENDPGR